MHRCLHAFMDPRMHPYSHASMHACIHPCTHPCTHPCIHLCIHASIHASMHPSICILHTFSTRGFPSRRSRAGGGRGDKIFFLLSLLGKDNPRYEQNRKLDFGNRPAGETPSKTLLSVPLRQNLHHGQTMLRPSLDNI